MEELIKKIAQELDRKGVPYMIIGGQAVLIYGEPRLTRDIDITIALTPDDLSRVIDIIRTLNLNLLVEDPEQFVKETWVLPAQDPESGFRVDFIFSWTPFEREAINMARIIEVEGYPVKFASPEAIIVLKIISGRARDYEDIRGILRRTKIDTQYVENWLREFSRVLGKDLVSKYKEILKMEGKNEV